MSRRDEINQVLKQVADWPPEDRRALATELLQSADRERRRAQPRNTLEQAIGILRTDGPPPTDEQVRQWIEEERLRKYGA